MIQYKNMKGTGYMNLKSFEDEIRRIIDMQKRQPNRFNSLLDLKLEGVSAEPAGATFRFDVREWCLNPFGAVHGGVVASILDTSMGMGVTALVNSKVNTSDMSVSYLSNMNCDKFYICCEYTKVGRKMVRCMAKVKDGETDKIYATAMASFVILDGEFRITQEG